MAEVEIKLQVPPSSLAAVRAAMQRGRCATTRMRAIYFDTPEQGLAAAGWALRLRLEGRRWVQTLKGPADGVLSRLEHEVALGTGRDVPVLDVARHAQAEGIDAFTHALGEAATTLAPVFETDVRRMHRVVRTAAGTSVEIALDVGAVVCGSERVALCEIEFELVSGDVGALTQLAGRWAERHGLWLDPLTKAERGWLLARGQPQPPTLAKAPRLAETMAPEAALRACVRAILAQVLSNAGAIAAGRHGAEHVHQLRVGLRRLRSMWREFGDWSSALDASLMERAADWFKALSGARDIDALAASLLPQLQAAGAPPLALPTPPGQIDPGDLFRSSATTHGLLALLAFAHGGDGDGDGDAKRAEGAPELRALAGPKLARLHRRLRRAGKAFDTLDDPARHRARKQLKRLRYAAECMSSLWPDKAWQDYLRRLKKAQDALGTFQDLTVAQAAFEARCEADPQAWFALGWIAARRPVSIERAGAALRSLGRRPRFLR